MDLVSAQGVPFGEEPQDGEASHLLRLLPRWQGSNLDLSPNNRSQWRGAQQTRHADQVGKAFTDSCWSPNLQRCHQLVLLRGNQLRHQKALVWDQEAFWKLVLLGSSRGFPRTSHYFLWAWLRDNPAGRRRRVQTEDLWLLGSLVQGPSNSANNLPHTRSSCSFQPLFVVDDTEQLPAGQDVPQHPN